jgi:CDP-diacylglycerol--glycerol-3-phosphate 3-phosphatidyltransferase
MNYNMLKEKARIVLTPIVNLFAKMNINPSLLTIIGLVINCFSAYLFAFGYFLWAGMVLIVASLFDAIDGAVARKNDRVTNFGAFLDSTVDRYSEFIIFLGIFIFYARTNNQFFLFATLLGLFGSWMVSYARARAEGLGVQCKIGLFDRTLRVTTIAIGALFGRFIFGYFLLLIVALTHFTSLQRIIYVRKNLNSVERRNNA